MTQNKFKVSQSIGRLHRLGDLSFGIVKSCKGIDKFQCDYRSFPKFSFLCQIVKFDKSNDNFLEQTYHWQL